ncbi:MAG: DUF4838 domain-containing protein [Clostridia bacterium]|nr:DUF4838 domain-containing protein [Clostridia bacterium]
MKKIISVIAVLLASMLVFCSCGKADNGGSKNTNYETNENHNYQPTPSDYTDISDDARVFNGGIHVLSAAVTDDYLIENGSSEYVIIYPVAATREIVDTAEDVRTLILEATGVKLKTAADTDPSVTASTKVISLGNTTRAEAENVVPTSDLSHSGYIIRTVDKSIYIVGNTEQAVSFGAYGFLEIQFDFDCFCDTYSYIAKTESSRLRDFDVKEVSDLGIVEMGRAFTSGRAARRMKLWDGSSFTAGRLGHDTLIYIDPAVYNNPADSVNYHPKWFSTDGEQLCYTARGDEMERELLIRTIADICIELFAEEPTKFCVRFQDMDINTWCTCDACVASNLAYGGADAAAEIKTLNEVALLVDQWMESDEGRPFARNYFIEFYAYFRTNKPPVYLDPTTNEYKPIDDSVICNDHIKPCIAQYYLDFQNSLYADVNKSNLEILKGWNALSSEPAYYMYNADFDMYNYYYDSIESLKDLYVFFAESNSGWIYNEIVGTPVTAWQALRSYVMYKLAWNVNLSIDDIIGKYFDHFFGDGGAKMKEVFYQERAWMSLNRASITGMRSLRCKLDKKELWPKNLVQTWLDMTNNAVKDISYLKKIDPDLYDTFYRNIAMERLSFEYILINFYERELDADYVKSLKLQAKSDAMDNNITYFGPGALASTVFNEWGV